MERARRVWCLAGWLFALPACGGESPAPASIAPPAAQTESCPPGTVALGDGGCRDPGIPPERCANGFEPDGDGGCRALLPPGPCAPGELAIPGDEVCAPIAPCGTGTWGDIAREPGTQHVDASYPGVDSDGSEQRPWVRVQQGIDAVASGGLVAVAAGVYREDVLVTGKRVRLRGRCPSMVTIEGVGSYFWALSLETGSSGSEVRGLAVTGPVDAVLVTGATGVVLEELWIHHTGEWGLDVQANFGVTEVVLVRSLIEFTDTLGVFVDLAGASLEVRQSAVRDVKAGNEAASAVVVQAGGALELEQSLVERPPSYGVRAVGATLTLSGVVVRDQQPVSGASSGVGVYASVADGTPSNGVVSGSVVDGARGPSIDVTSSSALVEATVVQSARTGGDQASGLGLAVTQFEELSGEPHAEVRDSMFRDLEEAGLVVSAGRMDVHGTAVRDIRPKSDSGKRGYGIAVQADRSKGVGAWATVRDSLVERAHGAGLLVAGSDAVVEHSRISDTLAQAADGRLGHGVQAQHDTPSDQPASLLLRDVFIEKSRGFGLLSDRAPVTAERVTVLDTGVVEADGSFGDGVALLSDASTPSTLSEMHIERSARAGVAVFGASVILEASLLECNAMALVAEVNFGVPGLLESGGDNDCGCGDSRVTCKVLSAGVAPPPPLEP